MQQYQRTLTCQYCGDYIGYILIEDISEPNVTDIQCSKCEVRES